MISFLFKTAHRKNIQINEMSTSSGVDIDEEVRTLAHGVRNELFGIKPGEA